MLNARERRPPKQVYMGRIVHRIRLLAHIHMGRQTQTQRQAEAHTNNATGVDDRIDGVESVRNRVWSSRFDYVCVLHAHRFELDSFWLFLAGFLIRAFQRVSVFAYAFRWMRNIVCAVVWMVLFDWYTHIRCMRTVEHDNGWLISSHIVPHTRMCTSVSVYNVLSSGWKRVSAVNTEKEQQRFLSADGDLFVILHTTKAKCGNKQHQIDIMIRWIHRAVRSMTMKKKWKR